MGDGYAVEPLQRADAGGMLEIFNHYIADGFAAYPEEPLALDAMQHLLDDCADHPRLAARDEAGRLVGFAFLRPYAAYATFSRTALVTYFIASEHTGRGLGTRMLARLEREARDVGIGTMLAHVSSENPGSLAFHTRHGFVECGRFLRIGVKKGRAFDVVWFQKSL